MAICQITGIEFAGRGKNHPALRSILDDAFRSNTRNEVLERLEAARNAGVATIEEFVAIASGAQVEAKDDQKAALKAQQDADTDRRNERRRREELNRKLKAAGYRWQKRGNFAEMMFDENYDSVEWQLVDSDGNAVKLEDAVKTL